MSSDKGKSGEEEDIVDTCLEVRETSKYVAMKEKMDPKDSLAILNVLTDSVADLLVE